MSEDQLRLLLGDLSAVQFLLWVFAALAALVAIGVVLKKSWPTLSNVVTLINLLLNLAAKLKGIEVTLEKVRAQVENSHSTNMRDENDERHKEVVGLIQGVQKDVGRLDQRDIYRGQEIREMDRKLDEHLEWSRTWSADQENADRDAVGRIRNIEDTLNPGRDKQ